MWPPPQLIIRWFAGLRSLSFRHFGTTNLYRHIIMWICPLYFFSTFDALPPFTWRLSHLRCVFLMLWTKILLYLLLFRFNVSFVVRSSWSQKCHQSQTKKKHVLIAHNLFFCSIQKRVLVVFWIVVAVYRTEYKYRNDEIFRTKSEQHSTPRKIYWSSKLSPKCHIFTMRNQPSLRVGFQIFRTGLKHQNLLLRLFRLFLSN